MMSSTRKWSGRSLPAIALAAGALIVWIAAGAASAQTNPPSSGDWYVATDTVVASQTVVVTGSVIVPNGVTLDLSSVDLRIDSPTPGAYGIFVHSGGKLNVQGGVIQPSNPTNTYRFEIYGAADIDGAQIQYMWGSNKTEAFGVQIYSSNVTIANSTIQLGTRGNVLIDGASPALINNRITLARYTEISRSARWTCEVNAVWEANGIFVTNGSHPTLDGNVIVDNGQRSSALDLWQQYAATVPASQCTWAMYIYESFLGYGLRVDAASAEVTGGVIEANSWIENAGYRQVSSGSPYVYIYRYPYNQGTNPYTHSAGLYLSAAGGNYTGISISNNYDMGIVGQGGSALINQVTVGNHTTGGGQPRVGVGVGNGITLANATLMNNYYHIMIFGSGIANFESLTIGPTLSKYTPAVQVDWSSNGATIKFYNTTFPPTDVMEKAIQLSYYSTKVDLYNCTIASSQIADYGYGGSTITSYWIFQATVLWPNGAPVAHALGMVTNVFDAIVFAESHDEEGKTPERWLIGFQKHTGGSGGTVVNSPLNYRAFANGTISDPFEFTFNSTTRIEITIEDPFAPSLAVFFPLEGARYNTSQVPMAGNAFDVGSGVEFVEYSLDSGANWTRAGGTLPDWRVDLTLEDGTHTIWVRSVDKAGGRTSVNVSSVFVDTLAPLFDVWQPVLPSSPGQPLYTNATSVLLRGTATSDAYLTLNGEFISVTGGQFSKQLLLTEGFNVYTLAAVDLVSNRHQIEFAIVSDTMRPNIYISAPPENYATNRPTITVAGVTETDVSLMLNGVPLPVYGGVFSIQYNLSEGVNTLRVEARDISGNTNSLSRAVFFDTVYPTIVIEYPTPNLFTNLREVEVRGTVESTIGVVYLDGAPVTTNKGAFARVVRLDQGANSILLEAWDTAGNRGTASVMVTVDSDPPQLLVTAPIYGALVRTTTVTVQGNWTGDAIVTVDGVEVLSGDGTIDERVSLLEGANEIAVVAVDLAGNRQEYHILVYRDTVPPSLSVNLPQTKLRTQLSAFSVTGNLEGGLQLFVNDRPLAVESTGDFTVLMPLAMGENQVTFRATDSAGNVVTSIHTIERIAPPETPHGLFGLGEASYALLPAMMIIGVAATFALLRFGRREE